MSTVTQERLLNVIRAPHISEKTAMAGEQENQYVFKVSVDATKPEIKAAVESVFNVSVEQVRVINMKGKVRRSRTGLGRRNDWKKAYVSLADGQQIDFTAAI
jgi:large subunit ribosomal protein L23